MASAFKTTAAWTVHSIDIHANEEADENILIDSERSIGAQVTDITSKLSDTYKSIICTAGGFAAGSIKEKQGNLKISKPL